MTNLTERPRPIQEQLTPGRKFDVKGGQAEVKETCFDQPRTYCMYVAGGNGHPCPFIANRSFWKPKAARNESLHDGCQIAVALSGLEGSLIPPASKDVGIKAAKKVAEFQHEAIEVTGHQVPCTVFKFRLG